MPRFPRIALILTLAMLISASQLPAQSNLLGFDWMHRSGDNPTWLNAPLDHDAWQSLNVGISWERQDRHNGDAWLRTTFAAPQRFAKTGLRLELHLPTWGGVDVFLNGQPLAATTAAHPDLSTDLPSDQLHWGTKPANTLALRVHGHPWTGGLGQDEIRIVPRASTATPLAVAIAIEPTDHGFSADADVTFTLQPTAAADSTAPLRLHTRVISDFHEEITNRWRTVDAEPQTIALGSLAPGFYQVIVQAQQGDYHAQAIAWLAVDPTQIHCEIQPEPDLDAYWQRALAELAAVPPAFHVERDPVQSTDRHDVFTVEMASVEGVTLRAWYILPKNAADLGPLPVVLAVPGYSAAMQPEWFMTDDDMAWLALDIRGHGRSADVVNPGFGSPGFVGYRVLEPEHYVYKGAYLDCGRALEFLASRPEIDASRIAVSGGSQGGGLSYASAALFPEHVALCVAGMPFLGDFADHQAIRDVYRTEMEGYLPPGEPEQWATLRRSMNLIDTACLADRIRCPVFMGTGLFDDDCPPHIGFSVFNRVQTPKAYRLYPNAAHLVGAKWDADARTWIRQQFKLDPAPES